MMGELPSYYELLNRFSLFDSSTTSSKCNVQIGANGSVSCNCDGCAQWREFVEGKVQYEVFTREHVTGLACYLRARAAEYDLAVMEVLEVGAGNGLLSQHLNRFLSQFFNEKQGPLVKVIATDSGARGLNGPEVKEEDAIHAITTRKPHIILSSWMPRGVDWTSHMRAQHSVREYILIGEIDKGICGCPWQTWGYSDWSDSDSDDEATAEEATTASDSSRKAAAPYERDGWERVELESLSGVQLCRTDERWSTNRHSHTVSFRRNSKAPLHFT